MKITFLCGCLEFGRDGVGDYVRRLSGELSKQGHHVSAVALNDYYVFEAVLEKQEFESRSIRVLRLPSIWKASQRFAHAKQWVDEFNPDWVSLQFVPFAFQTKGLPFFLSNQIFSFGVGRRWHIMFHELWVGMNLESSRKAQLWGRCQEYVIKSLIKKIKPKVIHTQSSLYQLQLKRLGFDSQILPLFTNIPYTGKLNSKAIKNADTAFSQNHNIYLVVLGLFIQMHP
jgi:hypothetical protein